MFQPVVLNCKQKLTPKLIQWTQPLFKWYNQLSAYTSAAGWHVPPKVMELNYFPSNPIGQWVIGDSQFALTNSIVDPNTPALANINITVTLVGNINTRMGQ